MNKQDLAQIRRVTSTEYRTETHVDEFVQIVDSLGRIWDALKHPRDSKGRFIRTFSDVKFNLPGESGDERQVAGIIQGVDRDGTATAEVTGVPEGVEGIQVGDIIKLNQKDVTVQTIKAKLAGKGAAGMLNDQEAGVIRNRIRALESIGLTKQAKDLSDALDGAMASFDLRNDPAGAQKLKDDAIAKFRDVAEELDELRGEGFEEGQALEDVEADLTGPERARLKVLKQTIDATFTARHSLGDKTIDALSSEGAVPAKGGERRLGVAQGRIQKAYAEGTAVWDATGGSLVKAAIQAPTTQAPIGQTSQPQKQLLPNLTALGEFTYQKLRSGLNRSAGWRQAQRVAPGDRFTVDKNGDQVIPSSTVMYTPGRGGEPVIGMVTRVALDPNGNQTVVVRRYDPEYQLGNTSDQGKPLPYKDHRGITSESIELASDAQQHSMFKGLALQGELGQLIGSEVATALAEDAIAKLQAEAGRRYAESGAKRTSPLGAVDAIPIHERLRVGANGEAIGIGDHVTMDGGLPAVVTYVGNVVQKSGTGTIKVMYPDGQVSPRLTSARFTKLHDAAHEVSPGGPGFNDANYVPTREQAAVDADEMGATSVAEAIRGGEDMNAIQLAMSTDAAFQDALRETPELVKKRLGLQAGQELDPEDAAQSAKWTRMTAAASGQFREDDGAPTAPTPPEAPVPEEEGERPQNPANPTEKISAGGTSVREEDGNVIVDDDVDNPIPAEDTEGIEQAVEDADGVEEEAPPAEPAAQGVAHRVVNDLRAAAGELDYKGTQRQNVEKRLKAIQAAVDVQDGEAFVNGLKDLTGVVNQDLNRNLRGSKLHGILTFGGGDRRPLHELMQRRLDAGDNLFGGPPVQRDERAEEGPSEVPEGVPAEVDEIDGQVSEGVLADDGSTKIMVGDQEVTEGFYVANQATVTEYEQQPTAQEITDFLNETQASDGDGVSISYDEATGRYQMTRVGVFDNEQDAADFARVTESNQYVNIADGAVMNVALDTDPNEPAEAVEDTRSEERAVRSAGAGTASARTTSKQKAMLDHVTGIEGADPEIGRITEAVKNGEEINGADASRLADFVDGLDAGQFDKPSDKGVASQMAHKLARAAGEEGARGYSSQNTALRRTSDVSIGLTAQSPNDEVRALVDGARADVKNGDNAAAAEKFRAAADLYDEEGHSRVEPSARAREHADRLDAMGGTTGPAPEQQQPPPGEAPEGGIGEGVGPTVEEALANAGVPEVVPITQNLISNPETERTREVTPEEFAELAAQGKAKLAPRWDNASEPVITSGQVLETLKETAWDSVQEQWGGMTVDAHNAQVVTPDEGFALTVKHPGMDTVTIPLEASREEFNAGMDEAMQRFGADENGPLWMEGAHLGVFRNEDTGTYDIDPVLVLDSVEEVEQVGAYTHGVGGAYSYADGLGYWPPYVAGGAAGGEGQAVPGEVARPGGEGGEAERGVGPPGEAGPEAAPEEVGGGTAGRAALKDQSRELLEPMLDELAKSETDLGDIAQKWLDGGDLTGEEIRLLAHEAEARQDMAPRNADQWTLLIEDLYSAAGDADDAARAARDRPAPAAAPGVEQATSALDSVNDAINREEEATDDNGKIIGPTDDTEEVREQLGLIEGRVTSEGPYTELSEDLRRLAQLMDDHWRGTDPGPTADELRAAADALDAGTAMPGDEVPQGGAPGEEGGGAPFRLDDPDGLHAALGDLDVVSELARIEDDYLRTQLSGYKKLLDAAPEESLAVVELNRAKFEMIGLLSGASTVRENLASRLLRGTMTPEEVAQVFGYDERSQQYLDLWNGTAPTMLSAESVDDFMSQRLADAVAKATADADEATANADAPFGMKLLRARMEIDSSESALRRDHAMVSNLAEYTQLVTEVATTLHALTDLRDPNNRLGLDPAQQNDISRMARKVTTNVNQANGFFHFLGLQGIDTAPFEQALREQLGKYDAEALMDDTQPLSDEIRAQGNDALTDYRDAIQGGVDSLPAATVLMETIRDHLLAGATPLQHDQLSTQAEVVAAAEASKNDGLLPDELVQVLRDPAFTKYGSFTNVLTRVDMQDLAQDGLPDDLFTATQGRWTVVEWEQTGVVAPELTADDRPEGTYLSGTADEMFNESLATLTPNVASALTSLFTAMGGGIRRTAKNIAEANTEDAERWRREESQWRKTEGSDNRKPSEVGGIYATGSNTLIVADTAVMQGDYSPVVTHELGHALDSMLGTVLGGWWFSHTDKAYKDLHTAIKKLGSFSDNPNDSILNWYFRNGNEGSTQHNDHSGTTEMFAQGLSVYASAVAEMSGPGEPGTAEASRQSNIYWKMGKELTQGIESSAVRRLGLEEINNRRRDIGKAVFEYFDHLENTRLPELMSTSRVVSTRGQTNPTYSVEHDLLPMTGPPQQMRATASQRAIADVHNSRTHGVIPMTQVERGTPEWDAFEAQVKQVSPGASMPGPTAVYVTWNPKFAEQGASIIWKAVMSGQPKHTSAYTDEHKASQLAAKFQREQRVNGALDEVHAKAEAEALYDETAALVLAMLETPIRVGSSEKAGSINRETGRRRKTFGGATMQAKHVFFPSETLMRFKFPGKSGKMNVYQSRSPALRAAVLQLLEGKAPTDQLFAGTNSGRSIDYIRTATGIDDIINHDTRTRYATNMARELVAKWPKSRLPKNEADLKKAKTEISKKVGDALNDTWQVARDSYISPAVWERFEDSAGVPHEFDDSPPYGLIEGEVVTSIGGPPVPGQPAPPEGGAPEGGPAPVAAAAEIQPDPEPDDGEDYELDHSPEGVTERETWYASFVWPDPPIVAGPDTTFEDEDTDDEPAPEVETEEVE